VLPFTICTLVTYHDTISKQLSLEILIQFWKKYLALMSILRNVRNNKRCSVVTVYCKTKHVQWVNSVVSSNYVRSLDIYNVEFRVALLSLYFVSVFLSVSPKSGSLHIININKVHMSYVISPNAWPKTLQASKRHTFRVSAFHRYHWFGIKLFPVGCVHSRMVP